MPDKHKHQRTVHVDALKQWLEPTLSLLHMLVLDPPNYNTPDYHPGIPEASPKYDPSLSSQKQAQVKNILNEFPTVATHTIGRTTLVTHKIATTELVPIRRRAYPCPAARSAAVQEDLQFLLSKDLLSRQTLHGLLPYSQFLRRMDRFA